MPAPGRFALLFRSGSASGGGEPRRRDPNQIVERTAKETVEGLDATVDRAAGRDPPAAVREGGALQDRLVRAHEEEQPTRAGAPEARVARPCGDDPAAVATERRVVDLSVIG